jgi:hypothetical protein
MTKIIAQHSDWKAEPMPSTSKSIAVNEVYARADFDCIVAGVIPREMEDKWFVFYEEPWLYVHRSWTGYCIFKVRFEVVEEVAGISEVWVNRDAEQYAEIEDLRDSNLLATLLRGWAKRDNREQMLNYVKSLSQDS